MLKGHRPLALLALSGLLFTADSLAGGGRLPATGGATQIEGAAGGGLVPWAVLSSYAAEDEIGATAFITHINSTDFNLNAFGAAATVWNRLEVSAARHVLGISGLGERIEQDVLGLKLRLAGDLVYTDLPQISLGLQYKRNRGGDLIRGVLQPFGLEPGRDSDWDAYLAVSRLFLGGAGGYNLLLNGTVRATRANELGLLGFGGNQRDSHELMLEASAAVLLDPRTAMGVEYRQKPDNLGLGEDDWKNIFIAWFPSKQISLTAAYVRLGDVAGPFAPRQDAFYVSFQGSF